MLPWVLLGLFALTRWPGMLPLNFSAAYALVFCAGIFRKRMPWWMVFGTMLLTDIGLNVFYYHTQVFSDYQAVNYIAYVIIYLLGRTLRPKTPMLGMLAGGLFGAIIFYIVTNTAAWLYDPEYHKNFAGWLQALTKGTTGWPETWTFFRNTLTSGGLFTALFAGALKLTSPAEEEAEEPAEESVPEPAGEAAAEEPKA